MDVWECDLIVGPYVARYNDTYRYIISVIDVFSKYLHIASLKSKAGKPLARRVVQSSKILGIRSAALLPYKQTRARSF
jgi:hypothetical protein